MGRFDGKVAVVTGATRGIGKSCAIQLAKEGAIVAVNHRATGNPFPTLEKIEAIGGKAFAVEADMRKPEQIVKMVEETARQGGRLDYLVSNAAINPLLKWDETTIEQYNEIQEINLRGTWVVCQAAAKEMIREGRGGAIVTVSSISAWAAAREQTVYCATKAGIWMLSKALGQVLGPHGIRVNCVLPGAILTDMSAPLLDPTSPVRKYYEERTPLGRIADPEEVATVVAFLLSEEAKYINSAELMIDGGFVANVE